MSPRIFDGYALQEVHEHYDKDGTYTGRTVVTREPLWDDSDRERALELEAVEARTCSCGCGQPLKETLERGRGFDVIALTCYAAKAREQLKRREQEAAKTGHAPEGWDDGRYYVVQGSVPPKSDPQEVRP